ncbi:hypothetical protein GCM10018962_62020 [Dactylosporangium matsuzakiense]|uniref:Uncharacterized protein n=1 Tax=Dactylosporangium matsuzakiense TaxID=53360 RepID=A0A9W6KGJ9_9ACTN|nr:hypothetical protein GCM10017581_025390 [Dactylosporangium matsuzakiense]
MAANAGPAALPKTTTLADSAARPAFTERRVTRGRRLGRGFNLDWAGIPSPVSVHSRAQTCTRQTNANTLRNLAITLSEDHRNADSAPDRPERADTPRRPGRSRRPQTTAGHDGGAGHDARLLGRARAPVVRVGSRDPSALA